MKQMQLPIELSAPAARRQEPFQPAAVHELNRRAKAVPVEWIRVAGPGFTKHHAVWCEAHEGIWTWCGRYIRAGNVVERSESMPYRRCGCCRTRIRLPYLVEEKLVALKRR